MNNKTYSYNDKDKVKNNNFNDIHEDNKIQLQKSKIISTTTTNRNVLKTKSLTPNMNGQQLDQLNNRTIPYYNSNNNNNNMKTYSKLLLHSRNINRNKKSCSNNEAFTATELNDVILKNDIKIKHSIDHINNYLNNHKRKYNSNSKYVDNSRSLSPCRISSSSRHDNNNNSLSPYRNSNCRNGYTNSSYMTRYITTTNNIKNKSNKATIGTTTITPSKMLSTKTTVPTPTTPTTITTNYNNNSSTNVLKNVSKQKSNIGVEKKKSEKKISNHTIDKVVLCLDELDLDIEHNKNVRTDKNKNNKQQHDHHLPHHNNHKIDSPYKLNSGLKVSNKDHHGHNKKDSQERHQHNNDDNNINHKLNKPKTSTSQSINFDTTTAELKANKIYNHKKDHHIDMNIESKQQPLISHTTVGVKDIHVDSRDINMPTLSHKESDNNSVIIVNSTTKQVNDDDDHGHDNDNYKDGYDRNDMKVDNKYLDTRQKSLTSDNIHDVDNNIVSNQYFHKESNVDDITDINNDLIISEDDYLKHYDHQYDTNINIKDEQNINDMKVSSNHIDDNDVNDDSVNSNKDNNKYVVRHDDKMEVYLDMIELAPASTLHYQQHQLSSSIIDTYYKLNKYKKQHRCYRSSDVLLQTISNDLLLLSLIERCNQRSYLLINQEVLKASNRVLITDDVLTRTEIYGERLHQLVDTMTMTIVKKLVSYNNILS